MSPPDSTSLQGWLEALERRHMADLTFSEVRRAVQALSFRYVEGRQRLDPARVLGGAGKRAAFALFYGPLHFLIVREIIDRLGAVGPSLGRILDLGCGTGASGAAWALTQRDAGVTLCGVDRSRWALAEARWTWRRFGLRGGTRHGDLSSCRLSGESGSVLLAYTLNELPEAGREALRAPLLRAVSRGATVLIVEPIATRATPWWAGWAEDFQRAGGRADCWRFRVDLPGILSKLDRAAGLDHGELTAKSLYASQTQDVDSLFKDDVNGNARPRQAVQIRL